MSEHHHEHHHGHCECGHHHDHDHEVIHIAHHLPQKVFILEHLGCANCAAKMERKINELEEVEIASITFATKKLCVVSKEEHGLLQKLQQICASIEPEVVVKEYDEKKVIKKSITKEQKREMIELGISFLLLVVSICLKEITAWPSMAGFIVAYLLLGSRILKKAFVHVGKGHLFDENFLMAIATIAAFVIGEYVEAVGVMLFFRIGELFENFAVERSRSQVMDAVDMRPEMVTIIHDHGNHEIAAKDAKVGDTLLVRVGERIPLDGTIIEGESRIDTSSITGEVVPQKVGAGNLVLSGCVNLIGVLKIQVTNTLEESMVTKILRSVEKAAEGKPKTERFITRFARFYTPVVVVLAMMTAVIPSIITGDWGKWIYTAVTFLVISCPCALVLSIPLSFFSGIGHASRKGILLKGGIALERLANVKVLLLDKTGTITDGRFEVQAHEAVSNKYSKDEILRMAASSEKYSTHPIGVSIVKAAKDKKIEIEEPNQIEEVAGKGVCATSKNGVIRCGSREFLEENGIKIDATLASQYGTQVYVAFNQEFVGYLVIADHIKGDAQTVIHKLQKDGIHIAMLTGDHTEAANTVAKAVGIQQVYAQMLPDDKLRIVQEMQRQKGVTMFVGDGINDAPVLTGADVGAAMGSGADAAMEAADVVFMNSSLTAILEAMDIARITNRIAIQNIVFALGMKVIVMGLGLFGYANMWMAVFADTGVAMLCVLNSIRILRRK